MSSSFFLFNLPLLQVLLDKMTVNKLPDSLIEETVKDRFQSMLMDFKEQGSTEEQLQEMATPEKYSKYKEISLPNAEKIVKLGLAFRDIAEKEDIEVLCFTIFLCISCLRKRALSKLFNYD